MKKEFRTNYVLYDRANDHVIQWESDGSIVIFGNKSEAEENCMGNEDVLRCTDLPKHWQEIILKQIN